MNAPEAARVSQQRRGWYVTVHRNTRTGQSFIGVKLTQYPVRQYTLDAICRELTNEVDELGSVHAKSHTRNGDLYIWVETSIPIEDERCLAIAGTIRWVLERAGIYLYPFTCFA